MRMKLKLFWRKSLASLKSFFENQPFDYNIKDKDSMLIDALKSNLLHQYENCLPFKRLLEKRNFNPNKTFDYLKQFDKQKFYYVHSYVAEPADSKNQIATSIYNDKNFCAMTVKNSNIIGTQFHPEKSSKIGLDFLEIIIKNSIN